MTTTKPTRADALAAVNEFGRCMWESGKASDNNDAGALDEWEHKSGNALLAVLEALTPEPNPATATLEAGETIHNCQDCGTRFVAGDDQDHLWAFVGSKTLCPQCYERRVTPEPDQHAGEVDSVTISREAALWCDRAISLVRSSVQDNESKAIWDKAGIDVAIAICEADGRKP